MRIATALYHLAVACWLGGAALFTFILTPTLFKAYSRDMAGNIVGLLFPGYFQWGLACGIIALLSLVFARRPQAGLAAFCLTLMLAITAAQAFYIEPRAAKLKEEIPSFVTTPPDHPLRVQFRKLHAVSAVANLAVIGGGVIVVILAGGTRRKEDRLR